MIHQSTNIHIIIHVEVNATSFFHQFQFFALMKRLREYNFYYCVNKIFRFYIKTSGAAKGLKIWVRLTLECTCLYKVFRRNGFCFSTHQHFCDAKGQFISKCLFGVFTFFQKTNENKSTNSKVKFVRSFFGRNVRLKKSFRICPTFINAHCDSNDYGV